VAPDGSPAFCQRLVAAQSLTTLDRSMALLYAPRTARQGQQELGRAAADLEALPMPEEYAASTSALADALRQMATSRPTQRAASTLARSLSNFGQEVQSACDFPVG